MKLNLTKIRKTLSSCAFDPNKDKRWQIIADNSLSYFESRAIECIMDAQAMRVAAQQPEYKKTLRQAIRFLVLALLDS